MSILRFMGHVSRGRNFFALTVMFLLVLLILTACARNTNVEPTPPTIHYGEDVCELCNMIINDERYAADYFTSDGQAHLFDDIGDMVQAHLKNQDEVVAFFAHDYQDKGWLRAEKATYVRSDQLPTPMASGLVAFNSPDKAKTLAAEVQGQVMTFEELLSHYQANPMDQGMDH